MAIEGFERSLKASQGFINNLAEKFGFKDIIILPDSDAFLAELADLFDGEFEYGTQYFKVETARLIERLIGGDEDHPNPDPHPLPQGRLRNRHNLARKFRDELAEHFLFGTTFIVPSQGAVHTLLCGYCESCFQKGKQAYGQSVGRTISRQEVAL